ncbi:MAG TPA: SAF domain-containing protein, partial [Steroidobacteraceae bacterium]|nr:SAF domain-containing protein [Steroidobacteraceae bacterium]
MDSAAPALPPCYRITARDDVAIALRDLAAGERVTLDGAAFELLDAIPRSHKFALRSVSAGEPVRKYGQVIGRATAQIARGAHVHTHNLATLLAGVDEYRFAPRADRAAAQTAEPLSFMGYRRADGRVGT